MVLIASHGSWDGINLLEMLLRLLRDGKWVSLPHAQTNQQVVAARCTMWRRLRGRSAQVAQTALCWFFGPFKGLGKGGAHMPSVCYSWATRISQRCPRPLWSSSPRLSCSFSDYEGTGWHSVQESSACVWEAPVLHAAHPLLWALCQVWTTWYPSGCYTYSFETMPMRNGDSACDFGRQRWF